MNTNQNQNNRSFQATVVGDAADRGACAFHLESFFTQKVEKRYTPEADGKKSRLTFGVTTNTNAWEILGRAEGDAKKYADKQESHVIFAVAFGQTADKLKDMNMSGRVVLTGKLQRSVYNDKNGAEHESVSLTVYNLVPVTKIDEAPKYMAAMKAINGKGEQQVMLCGACGTISYVGELKQGTNDAYMHFNVKCTADVARAYAVANGGTSSGENKTLSITVWGKRAEGLSKILRKDMPVIATGVVTQNVNNGTTYYNMSARGITLYPKDPASAPASAPANTPADDTDGTGPQFAGVGNLAEIAESEDDELPF